MTRGTDRPRDLGLLAAAGAVVCCGLPLLLAVGGSVTLAGIGLRSWLLVGAGCVALVAAVLRWHQRSARRARPSASDREQRHA